MRISTLLLIASTLLPTAVFANSVTVGCPGAAPGSYDYNSINSALLALSGISNQGHTVTVSGNCAENVLIGNFEKLTLTTNTHASITGTAGPNNTVFVFQTRSASISGFVLDGAHIAGKPVVNVGDSTAIMNGCTVQNSGGPGIQVTGVSNLHIGGPTVVQDNSGVGVLVNDNSVVYLGSSPADWIEIKGNGGGVFANNSSSVIMNGTTSIHDNAGTALSVVGGHVDMSSGAAKTISNNGAGISARGGYINQNSGTLLIENSVDYGASAFMGGQMLLRNTVLRNNGSSASTSTLGPFNMLVDVGGAAVLIDSEIRDSSVTGLTVRDNSSVLLIGVTITGNQNDGMRVETNSGVRFQQTPSTISGNSKWDLVCNPGTYGVSGGMVTVGKDKCPTLIP